MNLLYNEASAMYSSCFISITDLLNETLIKHENQIEKKFFFLKREESGDF